MFFQDEARFGRINKPQDCWAQQGFRPVVPSQIVREYTYAYAAVCPENGASFFLILPWMNADCMNLFLSELAQEFAGFFVLIVMDGAPCHSKGVLDVPANMMIAKIPPHSPELNPTENIWDDMREKFFLNLVFDSMAAVENRLTTACNSYADNPKTVQSITGWKWIIDSL